MAYEPGAQLAELLAVIHLLESDDVPSMRAAMERVATRCLATPIRILAEEPPLSDRGRPIVDERGQVLGWMEAASLPAALQTPTADLLVSMASVVLGWSHTQNTERASFLAEIIAARTVLAEMQPSSSLRVGAFEIGGWLRPARYVGGDCFDYFVTRGDLRFFIADAVGHGLASTLMSLECRALWRALSRTRSPGETAQILNELLSDDERGRERFVAACIGQLDPRSGELTFVCCGLAPCFLIPENGPVQIHESADPPLGVLSGTTFSETAWALHPNTRALFITDGVLEWAREDGTQFGQDRVASLVSRCGPDLLGCLDATLRDFSGGYPQGDDAAALMVSGPTDGSRE
ncbi:MAG: PP2C family protein-serine/threonine phosphatase [Candidatus Eremiobacterota bacterium]